MFFEKKWLTMLMTITAVLLLSACGGKEANGLNPAFDGSAQDGIPQDGNPQDISENNIMPISEGLEEYSVWIVTSDDPGRNSIVRTVNVFENGEVNYYSNFSDEDRITLEEINDLTDDEIILYAKEKSASTGEGEYTLDITIDRLGQNTEEVKIMLENGTKVSIFELADALEEYRESGYESREEYLNARKAEGRWIIEGENVMVKTEVEERNSIGTFYPQIIQRKIFDTTYSGLRNGDNDSILTRMDDSLVGFELDKPDTKSKNVTIEGE